MSEIFVFGAMNPVVTTGLVAVFLAVCVAMILIVLIQRPQGGGLSGAFGAGGGGGTGAGQTAFGTKTGDVLTYATIGVFLLFLILAVVLNFATRPSEPKDNTPTIVAPGTPRETVDDTELPDLPEQPGDEAGSDEAAGAAEEVVEDITDAVESVEEAVSPDTEPSDE